MKWVRGVALMFGGPVVLIVGGTVWGPLMNWDLTQPQATLIAGFVAGPFLITAAYIAFHGQRENMRIEREKFDEQVQLQKDQARVELQLKRDQWVAEQRLTNARNERDRDSALFARILAFYNDFARAESRTRKAVPELTEGDLSRTWALVDAYLVDVVAAANKTDDFTSELRLAGYSDTTVPMTPIYLAMRRLCEDLEVAVANRLNLDAMRTRCGKSLTSFQVEFSDMTKRAVAAVRQRDDDVLALANALETVDRSTGT